MSHIRSGKRILALALSLSIILISLAGAAVSQNRVPQFKDYPVDEVYIGKTAPLVLTKEDREFRTRLREAAQEKPNFAGRYIVTFWGCGTSCLMGAVIDAKMGRVHWIPHTICCWGFDVDDKFEPIDFRLESKLIVFSGHRNEKDEDNGAHFYKFENGRFTHIQSVMKKEQKGFGQRMQRLISKSQAAPDDLHRRARYKN